VADGSRSSLNERPELVPVAANARDEFTRMRIFVGEKKADKFEDLYRKYEDKGHVLGWNFAAMLGGPVWLFYRRLTLEGAIMLLIPTVAALLHFKLGILTFAIVWLVVPVLANQYYLYRAERRIYEVEKTDFSENERDLIIAMRGGGTMRGAIAGFLMFAAPTVGVVIRPTWLHLGTLQEGLRAENLKKLLSTGGAPQRSASRPLPACTSGQIQKMVQNMVEQQLRTLNIPSEGVTVGSFSQIESSRVERTCKMTLSGGGQSGNYQVKIFWKGADKKRFSVQLAPM